MTHPTAPQPTESHKNPLLMKIAMLLTMMLLMGGSITCVMTYINQGYNDAFVANWLHSWLLAAVTVMPFGGLFMTLLTKAANKYLPHLAALRCHAISSSASAWPLLWNR